jgi:arylsulfatase A-like enzyme
LRARALYDRAVIVLTSDHGEEFWDHGGFEHGHTLFQELIRVPLILKAPAVPAGRRVVQRVPLQDIAPTLLDLCGVVATPGTLSGESLRSQWSGTATEPRPVFSGFPVYYESRDAALVGRFKYVRSLVTGGEQLYDLEIDPHEQAPLAGATPDVVLQAREALEANQARATALRKRHGLGGPGSDEVTDDSVEALRALGYVN